jgi:hypothetical protein
MNVLRLALMRGRVDALDAKLVLAHSDEPHPLTGARVDDLLTFARHGLNLSEPAIAAHRLLGASDNPCECRPGMSTSRSLS